MIKRLSFTLNAAVLVYFLIAFVSYDLQWYKHLQEMSGGQRLVSLLLFLVITLGIYEFIEEIF